MAAVPHIEGLTVHDFLDFARNHPQLTRYLPDERDWVHLDRQWITDLFYTLDKEGIQRMIDGAMSSRKNKLEHNRDLLVQMRPEFVEALDHCLNFSSKLQLRSNIF